MKHRGIAALLVLATMMFVPMTNTSADETFVELPITEPPEGADSMNVAVYFADNMAFTPQWRLGNYIRIEIMVLNVTDLEDPEVPIDPSELLIEAEDGNELLPTDLYDQTTLRTYPDLLNNTNMVSVSEIWINITYNGVDLVSGTDDDVVVASWHSNFVTKDGEMDVTREINGEGHLIYGGQWDTSALIEIEEDTTAPIAAGFYTVSVGLPSTYKIVYAVQHDRGVEDESTDEVSLTSAAPVEDPPVAVGYELVPGARGGIRAVSNEAYIDLGELLDGSGSGANGGSDGGNSDGGNCYHGGKR